MRDLKGESIMMIFDKHANLKDRFRNRHFEAQGHCVSTCGLKKRQ